MSNNILAQLIEKHKQNALKEKILKIALDNFDFSVNQMPSSVHNWILIKLEMNLNNENILLIQNVLKENKIIKIKTNKGRWYKHLDFIKKSSFNKQKSENVILNVGN